MPQVRKAKISIVNLEAVEILVGFNKFMEATYPTMVQDLGNKQFLQSSTISANQQNVGVFRLCRIASKLKKMSFNLDLCKVL